VERRVSSRLSIWQPLVIGAVGIALCLARIYIGLFFIVLAFIGVWAYFRPPKAISRYPEPFAHREVETTLTRLRRAQIPTKYRTDLAGSRCHYCKAGIQAAWVYTNESGEAHHMCESCRDTLIVDRRRKTL
jgi:hypothetical protein